MIHAHTIGSKCQATKDLGVKEIAKLIRRDLKATFGKAWKFSVCIRRYAGGQAIDVEIKNAPCLLFRKATSPRAQAYHQTTERTAAANLAIETAQGIMDAYNFNDSDCMTDYFSVRFYGSAKIDYSLDPANA